MQFSIFRFLLSNFIYSRLFHYIAIKRLYQRNLHITYILIFKHKEELCMSRYEKMQYKTTEHKLNYSASLKIAREISDPWS